MIETNQNTFRAQIISQYPYDMPFAFWSPSDIQVWVTKDGIDTQLDPSEYMVSKTKVQLKQSAYETYQGYDTISFLRVVTPVQTTDYTNGTNIDAEEIEKSLDKLTAMAQQLSESQKRSIKFSVSEDGTDVTLPDTTARANSVLGFGPDGNSMAVRSLEEFDADVETAIQSVAITEENAESASSDALKAEGFAIGEQNGVEVGPTSEYYQNNARYFAESARYDFLSLVYPVGSIYMSMSDTSPASLFGGMWTLLDSGYALWTTDSNAGGKLNAGLPSITHNHGTITTDSQGSHSHGRGTMEITGGFISAGGGCPWEGLSGAFKARTSGAKSTKANASNSYTLPYEVDFKASNSWSGSTSSEGSHTHSVTVGDNSSVDSIYGNSQTVQPPAITVYAWKRVS